MPNSSTATRTRERESSQSMPTSPKQMTEELIEYATEYARQNPGAAALWCLGIGFVLGWKLKPW